MLFHCRGLRLVIFFLQASRSLSAIVPEPRVGGTGSRHPPEAVRFDTYRTAHTAKPSDFSFTTSRVSVYPAFATSYRKRAYTRALSRANRCGSTMYRERIYGSRPPGLQPSADQHRPAPSPASQVRQAARLHFLSWNSGGLSSERYQQLALWLRTAGQHIGDVAVQETHWSQDLSFHMDGWLALTSPCLDKVSGILLLVNLRHFHRHHVQFTSVLAGASSICARRVNPPRMSSLAINISMQVRRLPRVLLVLSNPWPNATYGGLSCIRPSPAFRLGTRFWLLEISTLTSSRTCPLSGRAPALALAECLLTELSRI